MKKYFVFLLACFLTTLIPAQTWNPIGNGMDDDIYSLCEYNGDLYAGGKFLNADGNSANHIARWNGTGWVPVGQGLNGDVWAMTVYNNELYVGGNFTGAGSIQADHIAKWNGTAWQSVDGGVTNIVYALCVYNGKLFAGGTFTGAGIIQADHIAQWDGTSWSALGVGTGGTNPWVLALATFNGRLIVGGEFTTAGGQPSHYVSSWNDTTWIPMGPTVTTENWPKGVYALCAFNNKLYAGGNFDTIGLTHVTNNMAAWDGASWNSFGLIVNSYVYAMTANNSKLYIGGYFWSSGNHIVAWDGITHSTLSTGMDNLVSALTFYNGNLYAGGRFTHAGANPINRIAWWSVPLAVNELAGPNGISIYPDPNNGNMTFTFAEKNNQQRKLEFYNSLGELVDVVTIPDSEQSISINESTFENGIYFYHFIDDGEIETTGKFVIAR